MQRFGNYAVRGSDGGDITSAALSPEQEKILAKFISHGKFVAGAKILKGRKFFCVREGKYDVEYGINFTEDVIYCGEFDPSLIQDKKDKLFRHILNITKQRIMMNAGFNIFKNNKRIELYEFKYGLRFDRRFDDTEYFDVFDASIHGAAGSGAFGCAASGIGYWVFNSKTKRPNFVPQQYKKVIKIIHSNNSSSESKLDPPKERHEKEYRFLEKTGNFRLKKLQQIDHINSMTGIITGKCIPGNNLSKELNRDLSVLARVSLVVRIMQKVQEIHDLGILHCDIKPANIMVRWVGDMAGVTILDFGLSTTTGKSVEYGNGTPLYVAPEILRGERRTEKADVYMAGRVIGEVLLDKEFHRYDHCRLDQFLRMRMEQRHIHFDACKGMIFSKDPLEQSAFCEKFNIILGKITHYLPDIRLDAKESLVILEAVRTECWQLITPSDQHPALLTALEVGWDFLKALRAARIANIDISEKLSWLHHHLLDAVGKLPDSDFAIKLFIDMVGFESLFACQNKTELFAKVTHICERFSEQYTNVWYGATLFAHKRRGKAAENCLNKLNRDLRLDLDHIDEWNTRLTRRLNKLTG